MEYTTLKSQGVKTVPEFIDNYRKYTDEVFTHLVPSMIIEMSNTFHRKKAAWQLRNKRSKPIGSIDLSQIYAYKISNEIFKKKTYQQKGKNHGIIILCDFSGSMHDVLPAVLLNAAAITLFCKRNNIPSETLTFTGGSTLTDLNVMSISTTFKGFLIFDTTMSDVEIKNQYFNLLLETVGYHSLKNLSEPAFLKIIGKRISEIIPLSSTPLSTGLMSALERAVIMKEKVEQVSIITISDGEGNESLGGDKVTDYINPFNAKTYNILAQPTKTLKNNNIDQNIINIHNRSNLLEPILVNQMIKDMGINTIQINLIDRELKRVFPLQNLENNKDPYIDTHAKLIRDKGYTVMENILGFSKVIMVHQESLTSITDLRRKKATPPPSTQANKQTLQAEFVKKQVEKKVLKIVASSVITEICNIYEL